MQVISQLFFFFILLFPSLFLYIYIFFFLVQDLRPKGIDVGKEELGDMVDKEMAATSAAIEEAVRRIDVSRNCTTWFISCLNPSWNMTTFLLQHIMQIYSYYIETSNYRHIHKYLLYSPSKVLSLVKSLVLRPSWVLCSIILSQGQVNNEILFGNIFQYTAEFFLYCHKM